MKLYKGSADEPEQQGSAPENSRVVDIRPDTRIQNLPPEYFNQIANGRRETGNQVVEATENFPPEAINNQMGWFAALKGRFNAVPSLPKDILKAALPPEAINNRWLATLKGRFDALSQLHKGVQWADVKTSLLANPEAIRKLQTLDAAGFEMNVFGEKSCQIVFRMAQTDVAKIAAQYRTIMYDQQAQTDYPQYRANGNAVDLAASLGVELADGELYEQLRVTNGWVWLKTDDATRATGDAFYGYYNAFYRGWSADRYDVGSFCAALMVKKV